MIRCDFCQTEHVDNTVFCDECGNYLLEGEELGTDPIEWKEGAELQERQVAEAQAEVSTEAGPRSIRLRIGQGEQTRECEIVLTKPVRLGRIDPAQDIYPEIDLTHNMGGQQGVSRLHACIFQREHTVVVEDLGSVNGTRLNGRRLAPYMPVPIKNHDQLELGKLPIQISFIAGG
jgi:pSer/pThr/pTyr-binding forkhead associated (FHA) protein